MKRADMIEAALKAHMAYRRDFWKEKHVFVSHEKWRKRGSWLKSKSCFACTSILRNCVPYYGEFV